MDDLDREIEEAVRVARRRVWRGRFATIASTATFFLVGIAGSIAVFELFPEPDVGEIDARERQREAQGEEPGPASLARDYSAYRQEQGRMHWKVAPVFALAFASAYLVSKRL